MNKSPLYPVIFIACLALIFGAAVTVVEQSTRELVEAGKVATLRTKVLYSLGIEVPEGREGLDSLWNERIIEVNGDGEIYYRALTDGGQPLGFAIPFTSPGFWGPINGVIAITPGGDKILGLAFISHQETPGLGGRISERWFTEQFRGKVLKVSPNRDPLNFVYREAVGGNEVEAITGATQTSSRFSGFINDFLVEVEGHPAFGQGGEAR